MSIKFEALESGMCDVIDIRLKRRDATRIGKGNQLLNIKKARITKFLGGAFILFYFSLHPSFLDVFYHVTHATFQCFFKFPYQRGSIMCPRVIHVYILIQRGLQPSPGQDGGGNLVCADHVNSNFRIASPQESCY